VKSNHSSKAVSSKQNAAENLESLGFEKHAGAITNETLR
jgi:hypothetical protein